MISKRLALASVIAAISLSVLIFGAPQINADSKSKDKKEVTFSKDVAPIFYKNCAECHRPNDIAPMSLLTYKEARPWARAIREKVITREMPPWSPDPSHGQFINEHRLTQQEIDAVVAWVDQGAKEGISKDLPPLPSFVEGGWEIGKPDVVLSMQEEYIIAPDAPDNYINFTIPTDFKQDMWVQAAEIHPGNKKVVHHVIAFIQTPEMIARSEESKRQGKSRRRGENLPEIFYRDGTLSRVRMDASVIDDACNAPADDKNRTAAQRAEAQNNEGWLLAGFAPGKGVDRWPQGMAKRIPAGSRIVFQMHYSSFRGALEKPEKDRTSIGLIFAKAPPDKAIMTFAVANHLFKIPAGADNHEVTACNTFKRDVQLISYMPHMHLRGKDMKYELVYPDGRRETLLWVPKFSFNWQTMYFLKEPVAIPKGAKIIVTAHFDNSARNKYNPDPKKDVRWGDPTYDEMMIGWMDTITDNTNKPDTAAKAGEQK